MSNDALGELAQEIARLEAEMADLQSQAEAMLAKWKDLRAKRDELVRDFGSRMGLMPSEAGQPSPVPHQTAPDAPGAEIGKRTRRTKAAVMAAIKAILERAKQIDGRSPGTDASGKRVDGWTYSDLTEGPGAVTLDGDLWGTVKRENEMAEKGFDVYVLRINPGTPGPAARYRLAKCGKKRR